MRVLLAAAAALFIAACGNGDGGESPSPGSGELVFKSEKGDHVLRIEQIFQEGPTPELPAVTLNLEMLYELGKDTFLEESGSLRRAVLPTGEEIGPGLHRSHVDSLGGRVSVTRLLLGEERESLPLLEVLCVPIHITRWKELEFEDLGPEESDLLPCGPFQLRVRGTADEVRVGAGAHGEYADEFKAYREKVPLTLVDNRFAVETLEVRDAKGRILEPTGGGGGREETYRVYGVPAPEGVDRPAVAYPVKVSIRVPLEYEREEVIFKIENLRLPPVAKR